MQEELGGAMLPAGDAARGDGLRNAQLSEALGEFTESLKKVPTRAALQRRRDRAWAPAVGDRCEGRFRAGPDRTAQAGGRTGTRARSSARGRRAVPCELHFGPTVKNS